MPAAVACEERAGVVDVLAQSSGHRLRFLMARLVSRGVRGALGNEFE
ncbi:hypothetical protein [Streptomyces goshikiensis]